MLALGGFPLGCLPKVNFGATLGWSYRRDIFGFELFRFAVFALKIVKLEKFVYFLKGLFNLLFGEGRLFDFMANWYG